MLQLLADGFAALITPLNILLICGGVSLGIIFGAIPGMTASMAIALFLPITYRMDSLVAIALLVGLYIGGISGGLISAVLLKIPGTPSSVATCFDGHPMAARGEAGRALGIGIFYSFCGGIFSLLALVFIAPTIASFAIKFSTFDFFAVALFSVTMISGLAGKNIWKGLISGLLGILFSCVGMAPIDGYTRFTFGFGDLMAGFDILPVLIGLFAMADFFVMAEERHKNIHLETQKFTMKGFGFSFKEFVGQIVNMIRSAIIGTAIGILPGVGGSVSNMMSYTVAQKQSKHPEKFGTGIMDGIVASETANNATTGGALIPLLTLGIPGDATTAMMLGALTLHGITPGPLLFTTQQTLMYGIFAAVLVANVAFFVIEFLGLRGFVKLLRIPKKILMPIIIVLCTIGAYALNSRLFDVGAVIFFGLIGYLMQKLKVPTSPMILGFIMGPLIETNLRRSVQFANGSILPYFTHPISCIFLVLTVLTIVFTVFKEAKSAKKAKAKAAATIE